MLVVFLDSTVNDLFLDLFFKKSHDTDNFWIGLEFYNFSTTCWRF